jgi:hypothetical protein
MKHKYLKSNNDGLVAIVVVLTITIILTLMTTGFATLMDRELKQSTDRELATQANYAAESGINDARGYAIDKMSSGADPTTNGNCLDTTAIDTNPDTIQQNNFIQNGDMANLGLIEGLVKYTCVNIDSTPKDIVFDNIPVGKSRIFKLATTTPLDKLFFSWNNTDASASTGAQAMSNTPGRFPVESYWSSGGGNEKGTGALRATIYSVPLDATSTTAGDQNSRLESLAKTYFMYPNSANAGGSNPTVPGSASFPSDNGVTVLGNCNQNNFTATPNQMPFKQSKYFCNSVIKNMAPVTPVLNSMSKNGVDALTPPGSCVHVASPPADNPAIGCTGSGSSVKSFQNYAATYSFAGLPAGNYNLALNYSNASAPWPPPPTSTVYLVFGSSCVASYENYDNPLDPGCTTTDPAGCWNNPSTRPSTYDTNGCLIVAPASNGYDYNIEVDINGVRKITNWQLSGSGNSETINLGNIPANANVTITWDNKWNSSSVPCGLTPGCYDPNFQIDKVTVSEAPGSAAPQTFYYLKLTALYKDLAVAVQGVDPTGSSVQFKNAQVVADVTAKGNNVLKRTQSRISYDPNYDYPKDALDSMDTICKKLRLQLGVGGPSDYTNAVSDPPSADCKP